MTEHRFLQALGAGLPAGASTPIWLMRQAGRFMPSYLALRAGIPFLDFCKTPDLCIQATLLPINELGADAAIVFADILLLPEALGLGLEYRAGEGPHFEHPIRTLAEINQLSLDRFRSEIGYVYEVVRGVRTSLNERVPLIGFAGSPFTVASYMVEGAHSKDHRHLKEMMWAGDGRFDRLMALITQATVEYLQEQVRSGAQALQLFDTWLEVLSPSDFDRYVKPHIQHIFSALGDSGVPTIYFGKGIGKMIDHIANLGSNAFSIDWASDLGAFVQRYGSSHALQGNLDPVCLYADRALIRRKTEEVLMQAAGTRRYVFNLGHGLSPDMDQDKVKFLIDTVHELSENRRA